MTESARTRGLSARLACTYLWRQVHAYGVAMTTTDTPSAALTVTGRVFLCQVSASGWSRVSLVCPVCDASTGLRLVPGVEPEPVRFVCPNGHASTDWRLTRDAQVQLVGADAEVRVTSRAGRLETGVFDDGDGWDDFRNLPL